MKDYTLEQIDTVAARFVERLQAALTPAAFESVRDGTHPNDVCDANQVLIDAFADVFGREPYFPSDVEQGLATDDEMDADADFLDAVWDASVFLRLRAEEWTQYGSAVEAAEAFGWEDPTPEGGERDSTAERAALEFLQDAWRPYIELSSGVLVRDF
jgi:hypothetical protein